MTKKILKEAITALKALKGSDIELAELCIHMETTSGEILELDIDFDETGELIKEYNMFETEEDYETYLNEEIPENILYN
jgi:hypothetical protein|tara:strand:- start:149 stop:385 length:237 start_codon:yes stop_codon:yes gene_type:complete